MIVGARDDSEQGVFTLAVRCRPLQQSDQQVQLAQDLLYASTRPEIRENIQTHHTAIANLARARRLFNTANHQVGELEALTHLGVWYQKSGDFERALDALKRALRLSHLDRENTPTVLRNLSATFGRLGDDASQNNAHARARELLLNANDRRAQALAWYYEGVRDRLERRFDVATIKARRSEELAEPLGNWRILASNLHNLSAMQSEMGNQKQAFLYGRRCLELRRRQNDRSGEAAAYFLIGGILQRAGHLRNSAVYVRRSLIIRQSEGDLPAVATTAFELGRIEAKSGDAIGASTWARLGSEAERVLRSRAQTPAARARISDGLDLVGKQIEAALSASKGENADPETFLRIDQLYGRNILEDRKPQAVTLGELRKDLLDDDTMLLLYWIGTQSRIWSLTQKRLESYKLASRDVLRLAEEYRRLVSARAAVVPGESAPAQRDRIRAADAKLRDVSGRLSRELFGEPLRASKYKRLLIVAPGVLSQIPLDALPNPERPSEPIFARLEVMFLPSASALSCLPRDSAVPTRELLLLGSGSTLPFAALETENILRYFGTGEVDSVPEGNQQKALGNSVRYRIIHLRGHGMLDLSEPGRSGIIGALPAGDVRRSRISAELVVLNSCSTASGRPYSGEAAISLANAFLQAGAAQVVATAWDVDDEVAAELIGYFYNGLRRDRLSPAAALAKARLAIARTPRWQSPYFWAAYAVHGVERQRWRRQR